MLTPSKETVDDHNAMKVSKIALARLLNETIVEPEWWSSLEYSYHYFRYETMHWTQPQRHVGFTKGMISWG